VKQKKKWKRNTLISDGFTVSYEKLSSQFVVYFGHQVRDKMLMTSSYLFWLKRRKLIDD